MKKYSILLLILCPIGYGMEYRDVVRGDKKREHHERRRSEDLRMIEARVEALAESGDEAGEDIDKILDNTVSIKKKVKTNRELLLNLKQRLDQSEDQVDELTRQMQELIIAAKVQERALSQENPTVAHLVELKALAGAISDRQIEGNRNTYLGALAGVGIICAKLGMPYLLPDWVWAYLPGAS